MDVEECRQKIIDMISKMINKKYICMIYNFVNTLFKEEKAGE